MRLVKTQANETLHYLKEAESMVMDAIDNNDYSTLREDLEGLIGPLSIDALAKINDLALYETEYTVKKIRKYINGRKGLKIPVDSWVLQNVQDLTVKTSAQKDGQTIEDTYTSFFQKKIDQYMAALEEADNSDEDEEDTKQSISSMTSGLFTLQNLALAGVAVIGVANMARADVAQKADLYVQWVTMMDEHVCDDCDAMEGETYKAGEEPDDIPMHANCRCTWDIVEDE